MGIKSGNQLGSAMCCFISFLLWRSDFSISREHDLSLEDLERERAAVRAGDRRLNGQRIELRNEVVLRRADRTAADRAIDDHGVDLRPQWHDRAAHFVLRREAATGAGGGTLLAAAWGRGRCSQSARDAGRKHTRRDGGDPQNGERA